SAFLKRARKNTDTERTRAQNSISMFARVNRRAGAIHSVRRCGPSRWRGHSGKLRASNRSPMHTDDQRDLLQRLMTVFLVVPGMLARLELRRRDPADGS